MHKVGVAKIYPLTFILKAILAVILVSKMVCCKIVIYHFNDGKYKVYQLFFLLIYVLENLFRGSE